MNRRNFSRNFLAAVVILFTRRKDDVAEHTLFFPAVMRRAYNCIPPGGTRFRLDISTLDSGHVLGC